MKNIPNGHAKINKKWKVQILFEERSYAVSVLEDSFVLRKLLIHHALKC
jgi:hypothetical protein